MLEVGLVLQLVGATVMATREKAKKKKGGGGGACLPDAITHNSACLLFQSSLFFPLKEPDDQVHLLLHTVDPPVQSIHPVP